jgi:hypothetical protein
MTERTNQLKEIIMKTNFSNKLAALAVALSVNGMLFGSVAYLFTTEAHATTAVVALAQDATQNTQRA